MSKRTHRGSCHCGAVRFECELELAEGTSRCNCSICTKARFWKAFVPADAFRLIAGDGELAEYRFGDGRVGHLFCRRCGVKPFGRVQIEGRVLYAINVAALDDVTPEELARAPVRFEDGRHDRWEQAPAETRYL
jgi:hypothetical protein